ncbi:Protein of unknown function [Pseudoxanthomonas sp. GM95]|uniref:DUF2894 domain-containing protein n=1 Tax=Pseudoxanthomonas sp. GM95 TaxID=1881043 RepID=UPI0008CDBD1A|nr:DUF2894 domain-containing protein [Pseudoxanthomonas sp. GM95]SEL54790.1 Protein of unknown function [Pseudoxanthomonas sp. GM95]
MRDALSQLARWRAQGADRHDPLRFAFLDALATRTQAQTGAARALLDARLDGLLAAYGADVAKTKPKTRKAAQAVSVASPLAELLDALRAGPQASQPPAPASARGTAKKKSDAAQPKPIAASTAVFPQMPALDEFQRLWEEVRTARQLRQSLEPAPEDAGPLNSHMLVHRALTLMHDTAPGYLQHFLGYVDALSWMAQLRGETDGESDAQRMPNGAKPSKPRARKKSA